MLRKVPLPWVRVINPSASSTAIFSRREERLIPNLSASSRSGDTRVSPPGPGWESAMRSINRSSKGSKVHHWQQFLKISEWYDQCWNYRRPNSVVKENLKDTWNAAEEALTANKTVDTESTQKPQGSTPFHLRSALPVPPRCAPSTNFKHYVETTYI